MVRADDGGWVEASQAKAERAELLTALKDLLAWANISDDPGRASDQAACIARNARAAIAKAEGSK